MLLRTPKWIIIVSEVAFWVFSKLYVYPNYYKSILTLDSGINIGVRLLIFEKKIEGKKMKNDRNALFDEKMN